MANKQNILKSLAFTIVSAAFALVIGIKYHAPAAAWIIGGFIWGAGTAYLAKLYQQDGEETIAPYALNVIGALVISIWAASQGF